MVEPFSWVSEAVVTPLIWLELKKHLGSALRYRVWILDSPVYSQELDTMIRYVDPFKLGIFCDAMILCFFSVTWAGEILFFLCPYVPHQNQLSFSVCCIHCRFSHSLSPSLPYFFCFFIPSLFLDCTHLPLMAVYIWSPVHLVSFLSQCSEVRKDTNSAIIPWFERH